MGGTLPEPSAAIRVGTDISLFPGAVAPYLEFAGRLLVRGFPLWQKGHPRVACWFIGAERLRERLHTVALSGWAFGESSGRVISREG